MKKIRSKKSCNTVPLSRPSLPYLPPAHRTHNSNLDLIFCKAQNKEKREHVFQYNDTQLIIKGITSHLILGEHTWYRPNKERSSIVLYMYFKLAG
jgi:hypothetical protein